MNPEARAVPFFCFSGSPAEIGAQHGAALKERIQKCIEVYKVAFAMPEEEVLEKGLSFKPRIAAVSPDYCVEIEAIAASAGVHPGWIYALNARTEVIKPRPRGGKTSAPAPTECTAVYFPGLLGQTWDWAAAMLDLIVVAEIRPTGKTPFLSLIEPGIIGKLGINGNGLAVALNWLTTHNPLSGTPVHILLRALLECGSIEEADKLIKAHGLGTASSILVAQGTTYRCWELADTEILAAHELEEFKDGQAFIRTNHYLSKPITSPDDRSFASSFQRMAQARNALRILREEKRLTREGMLDLLTDSIGQEGENKGKEVIFKRTWTFSPTTKQLYGTVCHLIYDLNKRCMSLKLNKEGALWQDFMLAAAVPAASSC